VIIDDESDLTHTLPFRSLHIRFMPGLLARAASGVAAESDQAALEGWGTQYRSQYRDRFGVEGECRHHEHLVNGAGSGDLNGRKRTDALDERRDGICSSARRCLQAIFETLHSAQQDQQGERARRGDRRHDVAFATE
jgi:hypothetical protein